MAVTPIITYYLGVRQGENSVLNNRPSATASADLSAKETRIRELEDEVFDCEIYTDTLIEGYTDPLKQEITRLKTQKAGLEGDVADERLELKERTREYKALRLKLDDLKNDELIPLRERFKALYQNTLNCTYSTHSMEALLNQRNIEYDREQFQKAWKSLGVDERKIVYLAEFDSKLFYDFMNPDEQKRYERFLQTGVKPEYESKLRIAIGFQAERTGDRSPEKLLIFKGLDRMRPMR